MAWWVDAFSLISVKKDEIYCLVSLLENAAFFERANQKRVKVVISGRPVFQPNEICILKTLIVLLSYEQW